MDIQMRGKAYIHCSEFGIEMKVVAGDEFLEHRDRLWLEHQTLRKDFGRLSHIKQKPRTQKRTKKSFEYITRRLPLSGEQNKGQETLG